MIDDRLSLKQLLLARANDVPISSLQCSARYHAAASDIAKRISASLSKASAKSVMVSWSMPTQAGADWENKFPALQISLRVFGQRLKLYLPVEVVTELCDGLLHSNSNYILSELSEKDSIAIGYLVGLVLNDNTAFPGQRAYLQAVDIVDAISPTDLNDPLFFELPMRIGGCDTTLMLGVEKRLQQIFQENAARLPTIATRRAWFEPMLLKGNVSAKIVIDDLHALLALKPGMRLAISLKEASLVLSQESNQRLPAASIALSYCDQPNAKSFQLYL